MNMKNIMNESYFEVIRPGINTTFQDLGRKNLYHIGVPFSGAMREQNGLLKNKSFLVTGKLNGISRAEVKSLIEENSGNTVSSVSNKLNYLIIGEKPTRRKVESAKELKIKIINQDEFLKMLNKSS